MINIKEIIYSLIFPPSCGICGKQEKEYICKKCEILLKDDTIYGIIPKNDLEISRENKCYFEELIYIFKYNGLIRKRLIDYKFYEKSYLSKIFAKMIIKNETMVEKIEKYDTIIAVPISRQRFKERGYNQSQLIAEEIRNCMDIELLENCIIKIKNNSPQSTLSKVERTINAEGVYKINTYESINKKVKNKKVLIVDDIYTTGNTVNEISKVLDELHPEKIGVLTIAKD